MTTTRILNHNEAEAVYSAMRALNRVAGVIDTVFIGPVRVRQTSNGKVFVSNFLAGKEEGHPSHTAFASAYGLDHGGEPQSDVAAAAGGLTQTAIER